MMRITAATVALVTAATTFAAPAHAAPSTVVYSLSAIGIGNGDFTVAYQDGGKLHQESGHTFAGYYWQHQGSLNGQRPLLRVNSVGSTDGFRMSCHITVGGGTPMTNGLLFAPSLSDDGPVQDC